MISIHYFYRRNKINIAIILIVYNVHAREVTNNNNKHDYYKCLVTGD